MKIKKGDNVIVKSGKDSGKRGKVLRVFPGEGKVVVEGVNMLKRHQKPRKAGQKGQIVQKTMPVRAESVMIFCTRCDQGVRMGSKLAGDKKLRICKKCGTEV